MWERWDNWQPVEEGTAMSVFDLVHDAERRRRQESVMARNPGREMFS